MAVPTKHGARRLDAVEQPVSISFDGEALPARAGEPLIVALLAAGVRVLRTMPHDGEARGGYCLVGRCSDCLVVLDGTPGTPACSTPVRAGMRVETQRGHGHWPTGGERR